MSNPFETPTTSGELVEEENLNVYWQGIKDRRNRFYLYLFVGGPALNALMWGVIFHADMPLVVDAISIGFAVFYYIGLFWFGYRVSDIRCYRCTHKLAMGQFFFIKNVHCVGCGFKFKGS